jgi:RNA recognition motif-containing protein
MRPANFQGNIHIINFPPETTAADLAGLFDDYGLVLGAHIKRVPQESGSLRLGIVAIAPNEAADKAIEALQGHVLGGQKLKLKKAVPPVKPDKKAKAARPRTERPPYADRAPAMDRAAFTDHAGYGERPTLSVARERFPAAAQEPPRKVIVEYRGRRGSRVISG